MRLLLLLLLVAASVQAEVLMIPLGQKSLNVELSKGMKWKNTCKDYCYQIWDKDDYVSVQIAKLNVRQFHLESLCQTKLKENSNSIKYCVKDKVAYLSKGRHLITLSHQGRDKKTLGKILGGLR